MAKLQYNFQDFQSENIFNQDVYKCALGLEELAAVSKSQPLAEKDSANGGAVATTIGIKLKEKIAKLIDWFREKIKYVTDKIKSLYHEYRYKFGKQMTDPRKLATEFKSKVIASLLKDGDQDTAEKVKQSNPSEYVDYLYLVLSKTLNKFNVLQEFMAFRQNAEIIDKGMNKIYLAYKSIEGFYIQGKNEDGNIEELLSAGEKAAEDYANVVSSVKVGGVKDNDFRRTVSEALSIPPDKLVKYAKDGEYVKNGCTKFLSEKMEDSNSESFKLLSRVLSCVVKLNVLAAAQIKILNLLCHVILVYFGTDEAQFHSARQQYINFVNNYNKDSGDDNK